MKRIGARYPVWVTFAINKRFRTSVDLIYLGQLCVKYGAQWDRGAMFTSPVPTSAGFKHAKLLAGRLGRTWGTLSNPWCYKIDSIKVVGRCVVRLRETEVSHTFWSPSHCGVSRLISFLDTLVDSRHRAYRASLLLPYLTFRSDPPRLRPGIGHSHPRQNFR